MIFQDHLRTWMTDSCLIVHYNFPGIFENFCQDLQTINFHVQLWGAACSIPTHSTSFILMKKTSFLLKVLSFCDQDISVSKLPLCPRFYALYTLIPILILFPFLLISADPGLNGIPVHSLLTDIQPYFHHLMYPLLCLGVKIPVSTALPLLPAFSLGQ